MHPRSWKPFPRASFYYCAGVLIACVIAVLFRHPSDHFVIFSRATQEMWALHNPYGRGLRGEGYFYYWVYSPSTSLLFLPFVNLPVKLGQFLFVFLSTSIFVSGLYQLAKITGLLKNPNSLGLFFLILSSDIVSSIPIAKVEPISVGILAWVFYWLLEYRRPVISGVLLGIAASWKFQLLPASGLLILMLVIIDRNKNTFLFLLSFLFTLMLMAVFPFLVFPYDYVMDMYRVWASSLTASIRDTWTFFYSSIYTLSYNWFGWPADASFLSRCNLILAVFLAAIVLLLCRGYQEKKSMLVFSPLTSRADLFLTVLSLGVCYTTVFSPLSQGAGYVLAVPMLMLLFLWRENYSGLAKKIFTGALVLHWTLTHLIYSDLFPSFIRDALKYIRPLSYFLILVFLVVYLMRALLHNTTERVAQQKLSLDGV